MKREKKMTLSDSFGQHLVYVIYEDQLGHTPMLLRVLLAGDLLDITDKLTDKQRHSIERRLA